MKLIVGLGNPGEKYEKTRHNVGFMIVEQFLKNFESVEKTAWQNETKFKSDICQIEWKPKTGEAEKIVLVKPKTFMNNSGMAVSLLSSFFKIAPSDVWIIYDDVDFPLGGIKIRLGGASGGHRGVESILESLGTDGFWRFRMGIGRPIGEHHEMKGVDDYVLGTFGPHEHGKVKELIKHGAKAIAEALEEGLLAAQNRFNA